MEEQGRSARLKGLTGWRTTRRLITWWIRDTEWRDFYLTTERYQLQLQNDETGKVRWS
jgi:hypothetical protein